MNGILFLVALLLLSGVSLGYLESDRHAQNCMMKRLVDESIRHEAERFQKSKQCYRYPNIGWSERTKKHDRF